MTFVSNNPSRTVSLAAAALLAALLLFLATAHSASAATTTAPHLLSLIPAANETSMDGYSRDKFQHWIDADHDGCDTRQEVLMRQAIPKPLKACPVRHGTWFSAYDGLRITRPSTLDIDHMIPLAESWRSRASKWNAATRRNFANDLTYGRSLIAVSAHSNRAKGDKDPAQWLPPRKAYRCTYVVSWIAIKYRWRLTIDSAERAALKRQMKLCTRIQLRLPTPPRARVVLDNAQTSTPPPAPPTTDPSGNDPRFTTCAEAKAAGYGPYYKGKDPEYYWYQDRDGDGSVCE